MSHDQQLPCSYRVIAGELEDEELNMRTRVSWQQDTVKYLHRSEGGDNLICLQYQLQITLRSDLNK